MRVLARAALTLTPTAAMSRRASKPSKKQSRVADVAAAPSVANWRTTEPSQKEFESWCTSMSIRRPHVSYARVSAAAGNGLLATHRIDAGETFVAVPVSAILTERAARESEIGLAVEAVNESRASSGGPAHRISPRTMLYLYLIHARSNPSCRFHAWFVHGIPRSYSTPLNWSEEELEWLRGTNLGEAVPHRLRQLRARFENAMSSLTAHAPNLFPSEEYTFEAFLWAHDTYSSRGFPAQLADPSLAPKTGAINPNAFTGHDGPTIQGTTVAPSSTANSSSGPIAPSSALGCLIPYIDLTNHRYRHPITWVHAAADSTSSDPDSSSPRVLFQAGVATEVGVEVLNNYGAKTNEEFLMGYGFTLRDNPEDEVTVVLGARALTADKLALLNARGIKLHHCLRKEATPTQLLKMMRVSVMDDREIQACSAEWMPHCAPHLALADDGASTAAVDLSFVSPRNELTMLLTLRSLLYGRLRRLASAPQEVPPEWTASAVDPARAHRVDSSSFGRFTIADEEARVANESSTNSYHRECALNYRIGQREVLRATLDRIDDAIRTAATQALQTQAEQVTTYALSPLVTIGGATDAPSAKKRSAEVSDAASKKKRKTGAASAAVAESPSVLPATSGWSEDQLCAYDAWIAEKGGYVNADWRSGSWTLKTAYDPTPAVDAETNSPTVPLLLSLPASAVLPHSALASTTSFAPVLSYLEEVDEDGQLVFFLLHERSKGSSSSWSAWIDLAWNANYACADLERDEVPRVEDEAVVRDLFDDVFEEVVAKECVGRAPAFAPSCTTWSAFMRAACIVQTHCVEVQCGAAFEKRLLTVPAMPVPTPTSSGAVARLEHAVAPSTDDEDRLIMHALAPLAADATVTLSQVYRGAALLPYGNFVTSPTTASEPFTLTLAACLTAYNEYLQGNQEEGDEDDEEDESDPSAAQIARFGLPLQQLTEAHMTAWAKMNIDQESTFVVDAAAVSPVLLATLRTFFLRAALVKPAQPTDGGAAATKSPSTLSGARIDDSDEEEEDAEDEQEEDDEDEDEEEEEEDDDAETPSESQLQAAARAFLAAILQAQMESFDNSSDASTSTAPASATLVPVSAAALQARWRLQQRAARQATIAILQAEHN